MGDLSELMASIAEKGIIEPLVLRQRGERYQIIAGERRYQAAVQVGLRELPGVIRDGDDNEVLEVALVENLQRKDLTAFEESEAMQALAQRCAYTHEMLAKKLGKSRVAVTESLALNAMPDEVKNLCRLADITSKSLLLQVVRQGDPQKMIALVERITSQGGATREEVRKASGQAQAWAAARLHLQLSTAHESLQPPPQFPQGQGRARRDHRGAGSHPRRPASRETERARSFRFLGSSGLRFCSGASGSTGSSGSADGLGVCRPRGSDAAAARTRCRAAADPRPRASGAP